mmetsp:Transcript_57743/g.80142  ORF Transcript_57743/g.80142 Transcript_57743/m.80142 type:complete len:273 (-) Transcript_57743:110-928(-)
MMLASIPETDFFPAPGGFGMTESARRGSLRGELFGLYVEGQTVDKVPSLCDDEMVKLFETVVEPPSQSIDTMEVPGSPDHVFVEPSSDEVGLVPDLSHTPPIPSLDILTAEADNALDGGHMGDMSQSDFYASSPEYYASSPEADYFEPLTEMEVMQASPNSPPPVATATSTRRHTSRRASQATHPTVAPTPTAPAATKRRRSTGRKKGGKRKESAQRARKRDGNRRAAKKFREKQKHHEMSLLESVDELERRQNEILAQLALVQEIIAERGM